MNHLTSAMDRLIKPEAQTLDFVFLKNQKCSHNLRLSNLMHTMPVALSLTVSEPDVFSFPNPFSIIPPLKTASFTLQLTAPRRIPPLSSPQAAIFVRSSLLPTGKASQDDLRRLFSKPGPHIFKDATIPISIVGADVAEFLLSPGSDDAHDNLPPEVRVSLFSKSIVFCHDSQLGYLLRMAALNGNPSSVSVLIAAGADVNSSPSPSESLISLAVESGNADCVQILIESGYQIDDNNDKLLLHTAASKNQVFLMEILCLGYPYIDINSTNSHGQTPLHISSIHSQIEALQFLLSIGANPDAVDSRGWTPLHHSSHKGNPQAVQLLLNHSSYAKHAVTKDGKMAFDLATENGHYDLFDCLRLGDLLHESARKNDVETMKKCIARGAKVNGRDQNGWTPLHRAAFKGHMESVEVLVGHGARMDIGDRMGYTPLLRAVEAGHVEIAMYLLSNGSGKDSVKISSKKGAVNCEFEKHLERLENCAFDHFL